MSKVFVLVSGNHKFSFEVTKQDLVIVEEYVEDVSSGTPEYMFKDEARELWKELVNEYGFKQVK